MTEMSKSEFIRKKSEELFELLNASLERGPVPYDCCNAKHSLPDELQVSLNLFLSNLVLDVELEFPASASTPVEDNPSHF